MSKSETPKKKGAGMKIIIDNQSSMGDGAAFQMAFQIFRHEIDFVVANKTGCQFPVRHLGVTTNVWIDTDGLNFRINDMKGDGKWRALKHWR